MDLRFLGEQPSAVEQEALDEVTPTLAVDNRVLREGSAVRGKRHLLLPALWALQDQVGWISPGGMDEICRRLSIPPAEAYAVASFYDLFSLEPEPPRKFRVCDDLSCRMNGLEELLSQMERKWGPEGESWETSPCLGRCEQGSAVMVQSAGEMDFTLAPFPVDQLASLNGSPHRPTSPRSTPVLSRGPLTARIGRTDPASLDAYRAAGGYQALRKAFELGPAGVIREVKDSGLVGRGGAAFPVGIKWEAVANAPKRPHYLVANADESEPGTFKDRALMEGDPFALIEAMTIAAYATGCHQGYIYIRGEYPEAITAVQHAIDEVRRRGWLGEEVMKSGWRFELEIRRGAGAYICGEETALIASIEGYRGEPRTKPPFPTERGLFGQPTVINNVETLHNIPRIVLEGGLRFAQTGSGRSRGTKLFAVSGAVVNPGLVEIEFGKTPGEVLELAGGTTEDLQTVLVGGAAGSFVSPANLSTPLTFEGMTEIGATLGSGAVIAVGQSIELSDLLARIARFFREESCGQCVPCREGSLRQTEVVTDGEWREMGDLGAVMRDASICGLGQTASSAIESALRLGLVRD